jgi:uncharacterized cupredoxin-like copper-binding protein
MAVYFVLGAMLVAWGLGLAIFGLFRADFPPAGQAGRAMIGVTVLLVIGTLTALLLSTSKEHPREEAAAKAAEAKAETEPATAPAGGSAKTVKVSEKEFSIALAGGNTLQAGRYTFAVDNKGKIQHDLAIEGNGINETKTPLIDAGQSKSLQADLKPGKYTFYCSVPGHEQSGMKVAVTVTGGPAPAAAKPPAPSKKKAAATTVRVAEKEFTITLAGGDTVKAGKFVFAVANVGKINHDLAIEGNGQKEVKTPLVSAGKSKNLAADLKPGTYRFYCTVPGHAQAGMDIKVTAK